MAHQPISSKDHARLVSLLEGTLSAKEFERLEDDFRRRPELREAWIHLQDQEIELEKRYSSPAAAQLKNTKPNRLLIALGTLVTCSLLIGALILYPEKSSFETVALQGQDDVAIVISTDGITWESEGIESGTYLKPGTLKLRSGSLELVFLSGATVALEGPAEIQIISAKLAYINYGKAAAQVPEEAIGFTLKTPDAAIVDLGTEFAAEVSRSGESLVHVFDGEVHVSLLGEDGSTLSGSRVKTGNSVAVRPEANDILSTSIANLPALPRVASQDHTILQVPPEYREIVQRANPLINWTFDGELEADIVGDIEFLVSNGNRAVYFDQPNGKHQYIRSKNKIAGINQEHYTVEIWVKPDRFHYATLVAIHEESENLEKAIPSHLTVLELMHNSHLIHRPNSIRFLHRWPASEVNAFSSTPFLPIRWQHLVAVKDSSHISLYLNGSLSRRIKIAQENSDTDYFVTLGQIDSQRPMRQFNGLIDEFAIYPVALSPDGIAKHYRIMSAENPTQLLP